MDLLASSFVWFLRGRGKDGSQNMGSAEAIWGDWQWLIWYCECAHSDRWPNSTIPLPRCHSHVCSCWGATEGGGGAEMKRGCKSVATYGDRVIGLTKIFDLWLLVAYFTMKKYGEIMMLRVLNIMVTSKSTENIISKVTWRLVHYRDPD
jgi:hypothetical protein